MVRFFRINIFPKDSKEYGKIVVIFSVKIGRSSNLEERAPADRQKWCEFLSTAAE